MPTALITGITGQDGFYLAELLLQHGYRVVGMARGQQNHKAEQIRKDLPEIEVVEGDLIDSTSIHRVLQASAPDEVYNLAAISYVQYSFKHPVLTSEVTGLGALRTLDAIRASGATLTHFYQASSSEMFGQVTETPQSERTPFHPRSPYGSAKVFAHHTTVNYREAYGLFAVGGILFNHESPRRSMEFVTRKISYHAAAIKLGLRDSLELGNLDAERDWGFAGDYVRAIYLMMTQPEPKDFVIGSGVTHSVRDFCEKAFEHVGLDWQRYVRTNASHMRPADVMTLRADASRAKRELGWTPRMGFDELVAMMVDHDLRILKDQNVRAAAS
jgi:GDPmannose 4,6-dehydratase